MSLILIAFLIVFVISCIIFNSILYIDFIADMDEAIKNCCNLDDLNIKEQTRE